MSGNQVAAPTRAEFRSLKQCQTLGEAFGTAEFLDRIKQSAPAHVKPSRMLRTFIQATSRAPDLLKCNMRSVLGAMLTCSEVGLEPNTPLQHAFLIPFARYQWNKSTRTRELMGHEVQLIFGYPGLLDLAYRSGHVTSVHSDVVWSAEAKDKDRWSFAYGTDSHLRHVPTGHHEDNEKPVWVYAHANLTNGQAFEVMPWADVVRIRNQSQGFQAALRAKEAGEASSKPYIPRSWTDAPWVRHEVAMARKTAFRSLWKWLPHSVELAGALALDEQQDRGTVDFGAVLDGDASIMEGGFTEADPMIENDAPDPTAAFGLRAPDSEPAKQETTKSSETMVETANRVAPRKSAAKKAAAPIDDEIPTGRWEDEATQTTAPAGAAQSSAPAAPVQTAGDANKSPASATLPAFSQFLVDGEGYILPDETGADREAYTDPVAFAHAYVEAEANEFPGTIELFRRANHDARQLAMAASNEVAAILAPKPVTPVQQAPQTRQEASPSLPMEMPVDPLFVPAPTSKARPEMVRYNDALTAMLAKATTDADVDRMMAVNAPTYDAFADPLRLKAKGLGEARKKELAPAPARGVPVQTMNELAAQLEHDIYSLVEPESCAAWLGMPGTKTALDRLMDGAPDLHDRVMKNLETKHQALVASAVTVRTPRQILNDVIGRMRDCSTSEEAVALIYRPDHIADTKALTPELLAELKAVAVALDNEKPEVWGPVKAIYAAEKQKAEAA